MEKPNSKDPTVIDSIHREVPTERGKSPRVPVLIALDGATRNSVHVIRNRETRIGRALDCDLIVEDSLASRLHCRIIYANTGDLEGIPDCRLFDHRSTNGTYVNGERVGQDGAWLLDRDRIRIGKTTFGFYLREEEELKQSVELENRASRDPLTGLLNKDSFQNLLQQEFDRAKENNLPLSLVLVDIDRFRLVNEQYGHLVGDSILKQTAQLLNANRRSGDILCRFGGEQFVVLMPQSDARGMQRLAERIRKMVEDHPFEAEDNTIRLTVSVGGTTLNETTRSPEHLLRKVDSALCAAKRGGRNQTAFDCPREP